MAPHSAQASSQRRDRGGSAFRSVSAHVCFWTVAAVLIAVDLWSKHWAFASLAPDETRPFISGLIDFRRSLNDGAVFGSFAGYPGVFIAASVFALGVVVYMFAHSDRRQRALQAALAMILAGALGNLYDRAFVVADVVQFTNDAGQPASLIGKNLSDPKAPVVRLGAWPDGKLLHTFDRDDVVVKRQGVVRDFIKLVPRFPRWVPRMLTGRDVWPWVFNVADAALVCGVIILVLNTWIDRKPRSAADDASARPR